MADFTLEQLQAAINNAMQGNPRTSSSDFAAGAQTPGGLLFSPISPAMASGESDVQNNPMFSSSGYMLNPSGAGASGFDPANASFSLLGPDGKPTSVTPTPEQQQALLKWESGWAAQGDPNEAGVDLSLGLIAAREGEVYTTARLAARTAVPEPTAAKILKLLARSALLDSQRGSNGGYELARPAVPAQPVPTSLVSVGPVAAARSWIRSPTWSGSAAAIRPTPLLFQERSRPRPGPAA